MLLKSTPIQPAPEETVRVARTVSSTDNPYLTMSDGFGIINQDEAFSAPFPHHALLFVYALNMKAISM
jgi:hypothetical protein